MDAHYMNGLLGLYQFALLLLLCPLAFRLQVLTNCQNRDMVGVEVPR
jgi:hypothetical protein